MSTITERNRDCLPCKIVSGAGLVGSGTYVCCQAKKFQNKFKIPMLAFATGLIGLGFARLFSLPPFDVPFKPENTKQL